LLFTSKIFLTITFIFFKTVFQTNCMIYTLVTVIFLMFHHCYLLIFGCLVFIFWASVCLFSCFLGWWWLASCCLSSLCRFQMVQPVITFWGLFTGHSFFFWSSRLLFCCPIDHFLNFQKCITRCLKYMYSTNERQISQKKKKKKKQKEVKETPLKRVSLIQYMK